MVTEFILKTATTITMILTIMCNLRMPVWCCLAVRGQGLWYILTEVSALDGAAVEGDAEVITCLPQLRNRDPIRAAD